jgi:predicted ATPase
LHVAYGNALISARGYGALETTAAFAKARESARGEKDAPERLAADYGLWVGSFTRGELAAMRAHAAACLRDVAAKPDSPEAGVAHRVCAQTHWFAGEYVEARHHLERALALFQPGRDDDLAFRFGHDAGAGAMAYLATTSWALGDVARANAQVDAMVTRIASLTHVGTLAFGRLHAAMFELMRGDLSRATPNAVELARLAREHDLPMQRAFGVFLQGFATAESSGPSGGLDDMRRGIELLREQNILAFDGLFKIALAEAEARAGDVDRALAILNEALATSDRTGCRAYDAPLHRIRGDILLKANPENPARAEDAYLAAVAIAREQGARSFGLQAALKLAKLYQSTGRAVEAHDVLAPALEGFSPTPEMPEIAEAQTLLVAPAETEEVQAAEARRQRRLHLQTAYSQALMWSKGYVAEETRAAFARVGELAAQTENSVARSQTRNAQFVGSLARGQINTARKTAESFLREAEAAGHPMEAAHARRLLGGACFFQGELALARGHFEQALAGYKPEWDMDVRHLFGADTRILSTSYLAMSTWLLGDIEYARRLIEQAVRDANASNDVITITQIYFFEAMFEAIREHPAATRRAGERACEFSREHGVAFFGAASQILSAWARGRLLPAAGAKDLRDTLALYVEQGNKLWTPLFHGLIADLETITGRSDAALESVDAGIALAEEGGERWMDPALFRRKGEILLRRGPPNPAPAEEAFQSAIAIAKQQGARSWGLRAALALAKLCQSTSRPADAHAVLAPALEGFSPTPEMPEIAEARSLLVGLQGAAKLS